MDVRLGRRPAPRSARPLERLSFRARMDLSIVVERDAGRLVLRPIAIATDDTPLRIQGRVGSSLYFSARAAGASPQAIQAYIRTLSAQASLGGDIGENDRFDLIVSNPPYIAADEMAGLSPEVRDWEPRGALTDEGDGLGAYRAIAAGAVAHLAPGGWLAVEIGPTQGAAVSALFERQGLQEIAIRPDLDGRDRVVLSRRTA